MTPSIIKNIAAKHKPTISAINLNLKYVSIVFTSFIHEKKSPTQGPLNLLVYCSGISFIAFTIPSSI